MTSHVPLPIYPLRPSSVFTECRVNLNLFYPVPFLLLKLLIDWFAPCPISDVIESCLFIFTISSAAVRMYERQTSDSFKPANINSVAIARHQTSDSPTSASAIKRVEQIFSSSETAQRRIFLHRSINKPELTKE